MLSRLLQLNWVDRLLMPVQVYVWTPGDSPPEWVAKLEPEYRRTAKGSQEMRITVESRSLSVEPQAIICKESTGVIRVLKLKSFCTHYVSTEFLQRAQLGILPSDNNPQTTTTDYFGTSGV